MDLTIITTPPPLNADNDGIVKVSKTRVTLDTVVATFNEGWTAEEIVEQYSALALVDVYSTIGYYLQHRAEVDAWLRQGEAESARICQENEARFNPVGIRERLLARRIQRS